MVTAGNPAQSQACPSRESSALKTTALHSLSTFGMATQSGLGVFRRADSRVEQAATARFISHCWERRCSSCGTSRFVLGLAADRRMESWLQLQDALHWENVHLAAESFTLIATISYSHAAFKKGGKKTTTQTTTPQNPTRTANSYRSAPASQLTSIPVSRGKL